MKLQKLCLSLLLAVLLLAAAGCQSTPASADPTSTPVATAEPTAEILAPAATAEPTPEPTPAAFQQSGTLNKNIFSDVGLEAVVEDYAFTENRSLSVSIHVSNYNENSATVWLLLDGINGWDVREQQQDVTILDLPGRSEMTKELVYDLAATSAKYMQIGALQTLNLSVEGYVDGANYIYRIIDSTVEIPGAPAGYTQAFVSPEQTLLDNEFLTVGYCGRDEATGVLTLYYEVKTAQEGASCKLYPVVGGVFDTEKYLGLKKLEMGEETRRLISFTPADAGDAGMPSAFYLVGTGVALPTAKLTLPAGGAAGDASAISALPILAENELMRIRYNPSDRRFYAENLTSDQVLQLQVGETFTLDGREVKANQQSVLCFPQSATAYRISGSAADERGTMRGVTMSADSKTLSMRWTILSCVDGASEPTSLGTLEAVDASLLP